MIISHADLAKMVVASYNQEPTVKVDSDVMAMITPIGNEVVVTIPGTVDIPGWLRDLSAWPSWFPAVGPLHSGFGSGGIALWSLIKPKLPPGLRLVFAAHSLGGALAQVCAALNAAEGRPPCRCVTFGAPRVGVRFNPVFPHLVRQALELTLYRRVGDPVYKVPFRPLYLHVKTNVILGGLVGPIDSMSNHSIAQYALDLAKLKL